MTLGPTNVEGLHTLDVLLPAGLDLLVFLGFL